MTLAADSCVSTPASRVSVSIIIAVYNDWPKLRRCLEALGNQVQPPAFEVIVVDDGGREGAPLAGRVVSKKMLRRRLHAADFQNVQGIWTARTLEMTDLRRKSRTVLRMQKLEYNMPLKDEDFTVQALRREQ